MKKIITLLLSLLTIVSLGTSIVAEDNETTKQTGTTTIEGKEGSYNTIQEAVNAADHGDTILLPEDELVGNFVITKAISLKGETNKTIIKGEVIYKLDEKTETPIGITISGINFIKGDAETTFLNFYNSTNHNVSKISIENCEFSNGLFAINYSFKNNNIEVNVTNSTFNNIMTAMSINLGVTNENGEKTIHHKVNDISNNIFNNVEFEIQPGEKVDNQYNFNHYDTLTSYNDDLKDGKLDNPTANQNLAESLKDITWPADARVITTDADGNKTYSYYSSLEEINDKLDIDENKINEVTVRQDTTIKSNINLPSNATLIIPEGVTLSGEGDITITGNPGAKVDAQGTIADINGFSGQGDYVFNEDGTTSFTPDNQGESASPGHNWVYRPSYSDSKDEEVKEYTTEDKTKACIELLGKGWEYSEANKSCVYTLDTNTQQIPNTSTR